ncbi:MAG TPA: ATP-binding protein [Chthoniobacterales bacterium]
MKLRSLRSRFALLCATLVAVALVLFAGLSAGLFYHEQLDAFSEDHTRVPSKRDQREAFEGVLTLLSCDVILLPTAVAIAAAVAWASGRQLLERLNALADAADGITIRNLNQRIPDAGTADEVVRLTRAFNALLDRLEQSLLNIKRFTADASHEFRLPLTLMKCEVEALLRQPYPYPGSSEAFERLLLEIHRLNRICDSLLFLTQADAGAVQIPAEPVDLSALCNEILEDFQVLAESASLGMAGEVLPGLRVRGDALLLRRMLLNLLDNARKYNQTGGWIRVAVARGVKGAILRVENSGPGIPEGDQAQLFARFYRVDASRRRETGGAGLGLSICREVALLHGGEIRLKASNSETTCFEVMLPLDLEVPVLPLFRMPTEAPVS